LNPIQIADAVTWLLLAGLTPMVGIDRTAAVTRANGAFVRERTEDARRALQPAAVSGGRP
jgi:hypothetical protein